MTIQVSHEEVIKALAEEFGTMLAQKTTDAAQLRSGLRIAQTRIEELEQQVGGLVAENTTLKTDLGEIKAELDSLRTRG